MPETNINEEEKIKKNQEELPEEKVEEEETTKHSKVKFVWKIKQDKIMHETIKK